MNGLVQKLLTLNQLEFGNDQVVMERFDIGELIRNKVQSVAILAQQKEAEIIYNDIGSVYAWGDEFKVEEVLTNYLSNALNHVSGERKITIQVEKIRRAEQQKHMAVSEQEDQSIEGLQEEKNILVQMQEFVHISVHNTGEAIPQEDIGLIWDKFFKVDKARTREYGGSGVGLSIVKAIMESFHQKYGVENKNNGVEFRFELRSGE